MTQTSQNREDRTRSRSPRRLKAHSEKGFRWKEKPKRDEGTNVNGESERRLERGYRHDRDNDSAKHTRGREPERENEPPPTRPSKRPRSRSPRKEPAEPVDDDIAAKFGPSATLKPAFKTTDQPSDPTAKSTTASNKPTHAPKMQAPAEPMIIVTVNDRLGTKTKVPCLASDPIKAFKALVAARIGRGPHEIMLKRQGERPMKDFLTLQDYGVSNGVQLDLELDTGD